MEADSTSVYEPLTDLAHLEPEELDVNEYNIPPVTNLPTLESILNESEGSSDEDTAPSQLFSEDDTASVSSDCRKKRDKKDPRDCNYLLRHIILRTVSTQMQSAADRVQTGNPTALAVASFIAIGTFHGVVLVYDNLQALKWCLGTTQFGLEYGSVSAMSFNSDSTRLLVGHDKGQINMWDLTTGRLLRSIADAHAPHTAVLQLKFTDESNLALCSDSGGSVFELYFRRTMGNRSCESRCIFSGSRGEVVALEPLMVAKDFPDHPANATHLVALATVTKVIVVTIKPGVEVWFTYPLKNSPDSNPILRWQFVIIQIAPSSRIVDPVLAFGRKNTLFFYQVNLITVDKINFIPLQRIDLNYSIQNFCWLTPKAIALLDIHERLHLLDVRTEEELEVLDLDSVELVYGSSYFKGLATGGNVSKAMILMGERACYHSMAPIRSQILLLGTKTVHVVSLRTWLERVDLLVKKGLYGPALEFIYSLYEDKARIVLGLTGKKIERKAAVVDKFIKLVLRFVEEIMGSLVPDKSKPDAVLKHYKSSIPLLIKYCFLLDQKDLLFGTMFDAIANDPIACGVFLEGLEPYILDKELSFLPPNVTKKFVEHYDSKGQYSVLEECLVRIHISSLDIHQVIKLSQAHRMYDAHIYVHTRAFNDYIGALKDLMVPLSQAVATGKELSHDNINLGNRILVYISCCLAGRAYPWGEIPPDQAAYVKRDMFYYLLSSDKKEIYPVLSTLLKFDTREFLNVLSLAFEEEQNDESGNVRCLDKQLVVDTLLEVMVELKGFSPSQVGALFTFLARQIAQASHKIVVNKILFEQVLEYLTNPEDETRVEERQQTLLELHHAGGLVNIDNDHLLKLATEAKFFRVCELLYEIQRDYSKILNCYLHDPARKLQVFSFISQVLQGLEYSAQEKSSLKIKVMDNLEDLVEIDCENTAGMLLESFKEELETIVVNSKLKSEALYQLLNVLFLRSRNSSPVSQVSEKFNCCEFSSAIIEKYIELSCQFDPDQVNKILRSHDGYQLESTLEICRRYKVMDATAYLLEKTGDILGAFSIFKEDLKNRMKKVIEAIQNNADLEKCIVWQQFQTHLVLTIQMCQRHSRNMTEEDKEALWFPLLEVVMSPQREFRDLMKPCHIEAFKKITKELLNNMNGQLPLPAILMQVVKDPAYNMGKFGEIRELVMGMFETYSYETTLLSTTIHILGKDLFSHLVQLKSAANRGIPCRSKICNHCHQDLEGSSNFVVFGCSHLYHNDCIKGSPSQCPRCQPPQVRKQTPPTFQPQPVIHNISKPNLSSLFSQGELSKLSLGPPSYSRPSTLQLTPGWKGGYNHLDV